MVTSRRLRSTLRSLLLVVLVSLTTVSASASENSAGSSDIRIVVSIYPLYLAVKEAFENLVNTELLIPARVSPHHYSLRPSEILKLREADLFVWIGPELENFLIKPTQQRISEKKGVFTALKWLIANQPDQLLRVNQLRSESAHTHNHDYARDLGNSPGGAKPKKQTIGFTDPHIWLSKTLVVAVITGIQQRLTDFDPALESSLDSLVEAFSRRLLQPIDPIFASNKFISYHNGFDYLARDVGFSITEVMTTNTDLRPGAQHLISVKKQADKEDICLITEPQFSRGIVAKLVASSAVNVVEIDPMGSSYERYSDFLAGTIAKLQACGEAK